MIFSVPFFCSRFAESGCRKSRDFAKFVFHHSSSETRRDLIAPTCLDTIFSSHTCAEMSLFDLEADASETESEDDDLDAP